MRLLVMNVATYGLSLHVDRTLDTIFCSDDAHIIRMSRQWETLSVFLSSGEVLEKEYTQYSMITND